MPSIDFFTKETSTSSFILDVLSSVDNTVDVHSPTSDEAPEIAEALRNPLAAIVIWDLDSFTAKNAELLSRLRDFSPDSMILAYAEFPERYSEVSSKLYDTILSVEALRLHLMSKIARLKEIYNAISAKECRTSSAKAKPCSTSAKKWNAPSCTQAPSSSKENRASAKT